MSQRSSALAASLVAIGLFLAGCGRRPPADSTDPQFATATERVAWMKGRLQIAPPSPIHDAHFREQESKIPHGHMGPGYSMFWLYAKIEIDPQDAPKWAAATKTIAAPRWQRTSNPMYGSTAKWSMTPAEFDTVTWYDPAPLVGTSAHGGYITGYMLIPADGKSVYLWQHWR